MNAFRKKDSPKDISVSGVSLAGPDSKVAFKQSSEGIIITIPDVSLNEIIVVFNIETRKTK